MPDGLICLCLRYRVAVVLQVVNCESCSFQTVDCRDVLKTVEDSRRLKALLEVKDENLRQVVGNIVSLEENYCTCIGLWMGKLLRHKILG